MSHIGGEGEALANFRLWQLGYQSRINELGNGDITAWRDGLFISVQVKSTRGIAKDNRKPYRKSKSYSFNLGGATYGPAGRKQRDYAEYAFDFYAFAALDVGKVLFLPKQLVTQKSKYSILKSRFLFLVKSPPLLFVKADC